MFRVSRGRKDRSRVKFRRMFSQHDVFPAGAHVFPGDCSRVMDETSFWSTRQNGALAAYRLGKRKLIHLQASRWGPSKKAVLSALSCGSVVLDPQRTTVCWSTTGRKGFSGTIRPSPPKVGSRSLRDSRRRKGLKSSEHVSIANVSGAPTEQVVVHHHTTGKNRFFEPRLTGKKTLQPVKGVQFKGIQSYKKSHLVWAVITGKSVEVSIRALGDVMTR